LRQTLQTCLPLFIISPWLRIRGCLRVDEHAIEVGIDGSERFACINDGIKGLRAAHKAEASTTRITKAQIIRDIDSRIFMTIPK